MQVFKGSYFSYFIVDAASRLQDHIIYFESSSNETKINI